MPFWSNLEDDWQSATCDKCGKWIGIVVKGYTNEINEVLCGDCWREKFGYASPELTVPLPKEGKMV